LFVPLVRAAAGAALDEVGDGRAAGTVAWAGPDGQWGDASSAPVRTFVLDLDLCDRVACVLPGPSVAVLDAADLSVTARSFGWVDLTRRAYEVDVPPDAAALALPVEAAVLETVLGRATVAVAAELVGTARWLLQASVDYARERVQFDRPIGSFQAVQHKLADMALDMERATAAVYYAAMTVDAGDPDWRRAVHVAKAAAGTAARRAAKDGIQVHGGIGYTWEHDLHLFLRRAVTTERLLGTTAWHHDRLADLLLGD
jgi:alkylation response protein AidB-like acyl-CoA dehydrogenase